MLQWVHSSGIRTCHLLLGDQYWNKMGCYRTWWSVQLNPRLCQNCRKKGKDRKLLISSEDNCQWFCGAFRSRIAEDRRMWVRSRVSNWWCKLFLLKKVPQLWMEMRLAELCVCGLFFLVSTISLSHFMSSKKLTQIIRRKIIIKA